MTSPLGKWNCANVSFRLLWCYPDPGLLQSTGYFSARVIFCSRYFGGLGKAMMRIPTLQMKHNIGQHVAEPGLKHQRCLLRQPVFPALLSLGFCRFANMLWSPQKRKEGQHVRASLVDIVEAEKNLKDIRNSQNRKWETSSKLSSCHTAFSPLSPIKLGPGICQDFRLNASSSCGELLHTQCLKSPLGQDPECSTPFSTPRKVAASATQGAETSQARSQLNTAWSTAVCTC